MKMKFLTIDEFIRSHTEEELWKIIDDYEKWCLIEDDPVHSFLWKRTMEYCYPRDISSRDICIVALNTYRYFALKYKEIKND